jgi:hypothetical protein
MAMQYFQYGETELAHLRKKDKKLGAAIDRMRMMVFAIRAYLKAGCIDRLDNPHRGKGCYISLGCGLAPRPKVYTLRTFQ